MKKLLVNLVKGEKGYGTVELLILVAAIGVLATSLMLGLKANLVDGTDENPSAVTTVGGKIGDMVDSWEITD